MNLSISPKSSLIRRAIFMAIVCAPLSCSSNAQSPGELNTANALAELKTLKGVQNEENFLILADQTTDAYRVQASAKTENLGAFIGYVSSLSSGKLGGDVTDVSTLLGVQSRAVEALMSLSAVASKEQKKEIYDIANSFLSSCIKRSIPNYKPLPVTVNVMPPVPDGSGSTVMVSGMDPEAIKDPMAKAAYLKAIAENAANATKNLEQQILEKILATTKYGFVEFASKLVGEHVLTKENVLKDLLRFNLSQEQLADIGS